MIIKLILLDGRGILVRKGNRFLRIFSEYKISAALLLLNFNLNAQYQLENAFPNLTFVNPVDFQSPNDGSDRVFIVEQSGIIKVTGNSPAASTVKEFLNITSIVDDGGEMGLLGLSFHPEYNYNGYFFVNYTKDNPRETIISRFQVSDSDPDSAYADSELIIMRISQPYVNHNGGQIAFGPDSLLYIALGDGGSRGDPENRAQNLGSLLGKILRINVDSASPPLNYSIPSDNPFKNNSGGYMEEIFAYGLRNPWRFGFDLSTGKLWCADVGQANWEEINIIEKGKNYGWRCFEGNHEFNLTECTDSGYVFPIWEYSHAEGQSITGGYVYRGDSIPGLSGKYIYADFITRKVWALTYDGINTPENEFLLTAPGGVSSFGVDQNNELFLCSFDGHIYRLKSNLTAAEKPRDKFDYFLLNNYPNPFNPATEIAFQVAEESRVVIEVYDILGNKISELLSRDFKPGFYREKWNASSYSSGIYIIIMKAEAAESKSIFQRRVKTLLLK